MENVDVAQRVALLMNELLELNPDAVQNLVESQVECDFDILTHPSVQVASRGGKTYIEMMGVLNGLLNGDRIIMANVKPDGRIKKFVIECPLDFDRSSDDEE